MKISRIPLLRQFYYRTFFTGQVLKIIKIRIDMCPKRKDTLNLVIWEVINERERERCDSSRSSTLEDTRFEDSIRTRSSITFPPKLQYSRSQCDWQHQVVLGIPDENSLLTVYDITFLENWFRRPHEARNLRLANLIRLQKDNNKKPLLNFYFA